jgi:hypothetical protein
MSARNHRGTIISHYIAQHFNGARNQTQTYQKRKEAYSFALEKVKDRIVIARFAHQQVKGDPVSG